MRHLVGLLTFTLLLAVTAGAQGPAGVGASSGTRSSRHPGPSGSIGQDYTPWQLSLDYQYNQVNLIGKPFTTNGLNVSLARYFGRWFGVEGQAGAGFGNTGTSSNPPNLNVKSLFVGGGPRLAFRNRTRIEPWGHFVMGWEHFKFTQTAGVLGSNSAIAGTAGGGIDLHLTEHTAFRLEGDEMGSRFFGTNQRHFQAVGGLVFNF